MPCILMLHPVKGKCKGKGMVLPLQAWCGPEGGSTLP